MLMTAAGDKDKLEKGKTIIKWAIIGVIVLVSAYAITNFIFDIFSYQYLIILNTMFYKK